MQTVIDILNSPVVAAAVVAGVIYLLNKLYAARPTWRRYQGTIIAAVRAAEKAIPDNAENKSIARLDTALKYVVDVFGQVENRLPSKEEMDEIREGIQIVHNEIEK